MYSSVNTIWVLLGAALVFLMQAGFAMCEAGFTRAKNTGNILMKNLMDFCIGTPTYWVLGFGLMFAGSGALIGGLDPFVRGDYSAVLPDGVPLLAYLIFQTVFCATAAWAAVMITIVFQIIKRTIGLRVSAEEELKGLDITEHGLPSAYGGFAFVYDDTPDGLPVTVSGGIPVQEAVPVEVASPAVPQLVWKDGVKLTKVDILCKMERFDALKRAMFDIGITGMTAANVMGCGEQRGKTEGYFRGAKVEATMLPIIQVSIVVSKVPVSQVVNTARKVLYTGAIGDGKIFIYNVENVVKVRTGEQGYDALQDEDAKL